MAIALKMVAQKMNNVHGICLIAVAAVVVLHLWKRNTLISIVGGTVCYMILVRFLF